MPLVYFINYSTYIQVCFAKNRCASSDKYRPGINDARAELQIYVFELQISVILLQISTILLSAIKRTVRSFTDICKYIQISVILIGQMEGKRTRGKPRIKMLDRIMTEGHTKLSYDELKSAAQDRLKWRHHYQDLPTQAEN